MAPTVVGEAEYTHRTTLRTVNRPVRDRLRYVVFGAGAIGGVVGGRLCQAGLDVTLIARGAHLAAMQARGLRLFPNVYAVSVACPTSHLEPGVVQAWSTPVTGLLDIGRYPTGIDQVCTAVAADFRAATFSSYPDAAIHRGKNRKLLTNLGNAIEAVCGPHERQGQLGDMVLAEGEAVLDAAGLETATAQEDLARRADLLQRGQIAGRTRPGGSSWQSLRRGTGDIETDYLNGEIVLLGRIHGVPTPANALLQRLARELDTTSAAPGAIPAATILERLGRSST